MANKSASAGKRFLKLASMTASIASKTVGNSLRHLTSDEQQKQEAKSELWQDIGVKIADTLGEMKGAAMKLGQIASQYQDVFPPEVARAIAKLQNQAPAIAFSEIQVQLEKELGKPLSELFAEFEPTPFAAASIGQVHRATLKTGENVVVKVQYPGVDDACESDLKQIRMALRLMGVIKIDKVLQERLFSEIRESLLAELNYEIEAQNLKVFKAFHAELDPLIIIPSVFPDYSSRRVLTLSSETGDSLDTASTWPVALRNTLGRRLIGALGQEMLFLQRFHCDAHPGNFAFRENGAVIIYDYGGVKTLSQPVVQRLKDLVNATRRNDITAIEQQLMALQILVQPNHLPASLYTQWGEVLLRPLSQYYDFAANSAYRDSVDLFKKSLKYWDMFRPSPDTLMVNRTISGHYWNLVNLKLNDNLNDLFETLIPPDAA